MVRKNASERLAVLVTVAMAATVLLVGAAGTVAAAEDACWEDGDISDCGGTGPTNPDDPMQSMSEGASWLTGVNVASVDDYEPCWEDGDLSDCYGTGPTFPNQ